MPKSTAYDGIEAGYPDLEDIPADAELHIVADGEDYNITPVQLRDALGPLEEQMDDALGSTSWRLGGEGVAAFDLLDEDDFASNSATDAPSQQSAAAYIATQIATRAATVHTHTVSQLSDATANGRSLISAANYAAMLVLLGIEAAATADQTGAEIVTLLEALTTTDRLSYTGVDGLDGSGAGDLFAAALIASTGATAGQALVVNDAADGFDPVSFEAFDPTWTTQASSGGAITLDFTNTDRIQTTTTEAITSVAVTGLAVGAIGVWRQVHTTARNTTWPATWWAPIHPAHTATANSHQKFTITRFSSTVYEVDIGAALVVA